MVFADGKFVLIIAPSSVVEEIPETWRERLVVFRDLSDFDALVHSAQTEQPLAASLAVILHEIGIDAEDCEPLIGGVLDGIRRRKAAPSVEELVPEGMSRRTFYRRWSESLAYTPRAFLAKLRLLHALALVAAGRSPKEASEIAGYTNVYQFYRHRSRMAQNG